MKWVGIFGCLLFCSLQAEECLDIRIPALDMRDYFSKDLRGEFLDTLYQAMAEVGFFAISHTGVDAEVVKRAYEEAESFFRQDAEEKMRCFSPETHCQRGFVPGEVAKGRAEKDRKEFYHIGREGLDPGNIWPENSDFTDAMQTLYRELGRYIEPLQQAIVASINRQAGVSLDLDLLNEMTANGQSLLRALYYPALTAEQLQGKNQPLYWAAPHTDIDFLAILPYATAKGLQVERDGKWLNIIAPEDTFIVNVGDMLENLTNGLFVSGKHRVLAQRADEDRFSMVLFVHPRDESRLDPLDACIQLTGGVQTYAPGNRLEFLWERLLELDIAPYLLESYAKTGHTERQMRYGRESPQVVELLKRQGLLSQIE